MRLQMSLSQEMAKALEIEKNERMLCSTQETMRSIIADYFMFKKMQDKKRKKTSHRKKEKLEIKKNPLIV